MIAAEPTGPATGPPPPPPKGVAEAAQKSAQNDPAGQNVAGQDLQGNNAEQTVMGSAGKEKTAKERTSE